MKKTLAVLAAVTLGLLGVGLGTTAASATSADAISTNHTFVVEAGATLTNTQLCSASSRFVTGMIATGGHVEFNEGNPADLAVVSEDVTPGGDGYTATVINNDTVARGYLIWADCAVPEVPTVTETYSWVTTLADGVTTPVNASSVTWPQTLAGQGDLVPACDVWYQVDTYTGTRAEIDAVVGDGVLTGNPPEDSGIVTDWKFTYGGDCPAVVVTPPVVPPTTPTAELAHTGVVTGGLVPWAAGLLAFGLLLSFGRKLVRR